MKSYYQIAILALVVFASACSQSPTQPSQLSRTGATAEPLAAAFGVVGSQAAPLLVDWSTMTQSAGMALPLAVGEDRPGAPSNLTFVISGTTVALTWNPPPGPAPTSYVLQAGTGPGLTDLVSFNTGMVAALTVGDVPPGIYYVRVRAANDDGLGDASNELVITVTGAGPCSRASAPDRPTNLIFQLTGTSLALSWTAPVRGCVPTGYLIEAGSTPGASNLASVSTGSVTTFFASGVPPATYYVRVRGVNELGPGAGSNEVVVIVRSGTPPPTPAFNGTYTGRAIGTQINLDGSTGPSNFLLTATIDNDVITGTLSTPPDPDEPQGTLPLSGRASASGGVTFTATDLCGGALYSFTGSVTLASGGGAEMAGTWSQPASANCSRGASGTFTMTR
jgi:hypothetical protein